jgi:protein phosphatase
VTCIVADVIEATDLGDDAPAVVGAASQTKPVDHPTDRLNGSAAERAAALTAPPAPPAEAPVAGPRRTGLVVRRVLGGVVVVAVLVAGVAAAWQWVQHQYFVGARRDAVAVFRGLPESVGPLHLAWVDQPADDVKIADLPVFAQDKVRRGIPAASHAEAGKIVDNLRQQAADCRAAAAATSPSPSPSASPATPGPTPTPILSGPLTPAASPAVSPTASGAAVGSPVPVPSSTVGSPVIAVNPQATVTGVPSATPSPVPAGCGGLTP